MWRSTPILSGTSDPEIQDKAVFALSQHDSRAARQSLRRYAERTNISSDIREKAVFWLGQSDDPEDADLPADSLFPKVTDFELKDKILFALSQNDDAASGRFLAETWRGTPARTSSSGRRRSSGWASATR